MRERGGEGGGGGGSKQTERQTETERQRHIEVHRARFKSGIYVCYTFSMISRQKLKLKSHNNVDLIWV